MSRQALAAAALLLLAHQAAGIYLLLGPHDPPRCLVLDGYRSPDQTACFGEECVGMQISINPVAVRMTVRGPDAKGTEVIASTLSDKSGKVAFTSRKDGEHYICFQLNDTAVANDAPLCPLKCALQRFYVVAKTADEAVDYSALADAAHMSEMEVEVRRLNDKLAFIRFEMTYHKALDDVFTRMSGAVGRKITIWMLIQAAIFCGATYAQMYFLKSMFVKKKLV